MIRGVIFDIDNTLMNFMKMKRDAVDAAAEAMIDSGLKMDKDLLVKKIFDLYWQEGIEDQNIFDKILVQEFGHVDYKVLAAGILGYRRAKAGSIAVYPHVHMTLTKLLRWGIKMVVISDAPRLPVWLRIVGLNLHHFFDHVITFDDTGERKPSPVPFRKALEALKTKPQETIMVGDWADRDIVGAKKVNVKTAWAKYGNEFDTVDSGADYELDDIMDLLDIVLRENESQLGLFDKKYPDNAIAKPPEA